MQIVFSPVAAKANHSVNMQKAPPQKGKRQGLIGS
jgi:hypothetical protein